MPTSSENGAIEAELKQLFPTAPQVELRQSPKRAPLPPQVIDKAILTAGLLAHLMVANFADQLPLYRQEKIFGRAGLEIARST